MGQLTTNRSPVTVRRVSEAGREFLVAPMSLINPGILNGSQGALLYTPDDCKQTINDWNGVPIVVYHPTRNGQNVSASAPGVWEESGVGRVKNAHFDRKSKAEGWFDVEKLRQVDNTLPEHVRILPRLQRGQPVELSTGLFTDNDPSPGLHNGRGYDAVARNHRPDHLAVLPDQVGACSINDGCGVMVNQLTVNSWAPVMATNAAKKPDDMSEREYVQLLSDRADQATRGGKDDDTHERAMKAHKDAAKACREAADGDDDAQLDGQDYTVRQHYDDLAKYHDARMHEHAIKAGKKVPTGNQGDAEDTALNPKAYGKRVGSVADALTKNSTCPKCGGPMQDGQCRFCHYAEQQPASNDANFVSEAQRKFMWSQRPDIAEDWAHGEHSSDSDHKMSSGPGPDVKGLRAAMVRKKGGNKVTKNSLFRRVMAAVADTLGLTGNAEDFGDASAPARGIGSNPSQPRHPATGQYQGKASVAAKLGAAHRDHEQAPEEDPDDDGDTHPEIGQGDRPLESLDPNEIGVKTDNPLSPMRREETGLRKVATNADDEDEDEDGEEEETNNARKKDDDEDDCDDEDHDDDSDEDCTENVRSWIVYNRDWPQEKRDKLDEKDFAGPDQSFPIATQEDLDAAVKSIGRGKHPASVIKAGIKRIAKRKNLTLPDSWRTDNMFPPHDASKAAMGATAQAGHSPAMKPAAAALQHAPDDPEKAAAFHDQAADAHQEAATDAYKANKPDEGDAHANAAALHMKAAAMHTATCNASSFTSLPRDAQKAAFAAMEEDTSSPSGAAGAASRRAMASGKSSHHAAAAKAHKEAAKHHRDEGNDERAEQHTQAARFHSRKEKATANRRNVMKLPRDPQQRAARLKELRPMMMNFLTTNCSCSKERAAYNDLNDETLRAIYNAKAEGSNADVIGEGGKKFVQAGGEEDDDGDDTSDNYKSKEAPELDDDIDFGDDEVHGKKMTDNQRNRLSMQMYGMPHRAVTSALKFVAEKEAQARRDLLERLTANAQSDKLKRAAWEVYARMDLPTLRSLAAALPPPDSAGYYPDARTLSANYLGAAGGPVDNFGPEPEQDPDDILQLPTLNWSEVAKDQRTEDSHRKQA